MKKTQKKTIVYLVIVVTTSLVFACKKDDNKPQVSVYKPNLPSTPYDYADQSGYPSYILNFLTNASSYADDTPSDNPITNAGATLGRVLFYDKALSLNFTTSCASCHKQELGFADNKKFSRGFNGGFTTRNAMAVINLRYVSSGKMFWDLRAENLEAQSIMPVTHVVEMGMPSMEYVVNRIESLGYYQDLFFNAFGSQEITVDKIKKALAQFMRSMTSFNSKYDQGVPLNFSNFSVSENNGRQLISDLFCLECHGDEESVVNLTTPTFLTATNGSRSANNGLDAQYADNGIGALTGLASDMGLFAAPTLRNIELTAPYMHDGRFSTLEEVVEFYSSGIQNHPNKGIQLPSGGYNLSTQQKADIVAFLKTLTDESFTTDIRFSDPFK